MTTYKRNNAPLPYGEMAPRFELTAIDGTCYSRAQFRGKSALVLIFFIPCVPVLALLDQICADATEYRELNARVIGIGLGTHEDIKQTALSINDCDGFLPILIDDTLQVWEQYSGQDHAAPVAGYGVFVLDTYGAVEVQQVAADPDGLPSASAILEWTRGAQYKCNI